MELYDWQADSSLGDKNDDLGFYGLVFLLAILTLTVTFLAVT